MHAIPRLRRACSRALLAAAGFALLATGSAHANPKYAGYVYDVNAGRALYADSATEKRYPASLTKIMTTYIIFEELAAGRMTLRTQMSVSKYAAARPPSKIGFKPGATIEVRDAIKALVTKSANDVAAVVAEHIGGSERAFAKRMTTTAKRLGMNSTVFRNPHGLPDDRQFTTAQDMATLGIAIQRDFPQYYGVFQTRVFQYGKRRYGNHNKLLGRVEGVDGIKTGYIRASGFNLVTSVRRDGRHIVAVVMGGRTGASRNKHMKSLIARTLPKARKGKVMPLMAWNDRVPPPLPSAKPAMAAVYVARFNAKTEDASGDDPIEAQILAFAADTRRTAAPLIATHASDPDTLTAVIAEASEAGVALPSAEPLPAVAEGSSPDRFSATFAVLTTTAASNDNDGVEALLAAFSRSATAAPKKARPAELRVQAVPRGAWQIQVGAVGSQGEADQLLSAAARSIPGLDGHQRVTVPVTTERGTLYRARFAGFQSQSDARAACKRFANQNRPCWAVSM
ncbi:MAG: D-alanyl-D-alanine carboxypeptidase family protein [Acuticoccus sp.]